MQHLAARATSLHSDRPFTATGLGDRIHHLSCCWAYSVAHAQPVTLHLDARKWEGGQFRNKPESWREILALFPPGWLYLCVHNVYPASERDWLQHLDGIPVWRYGDLGTGIDIEPYLRNLSLLDAEPLPGRYITQQWDANAPARQFPREAVQAKQDLPLLTIGGEATDPYRWSLKDIARALAGAEKHIGVDSAFMHMALLYLPPERIEIYTTGAESHHLRRAREHGASIRHHA